MVQVSYFVSNKNQAKITKIAGLSYLSQCKQGTYTQSIDVYYKDSIWYSKIIQKSLSQIVKKSTFIPNTIPKQNPIEHRNTKSISII